jgi:isoquinoline 1-oxidoreductase alpha subunit
MPRYSFVLNGKQTTVDAPADMPLLWVLRDLLVVTGPKYGCGVGVCRACTSHLDGAEIQPCVVPVADCAGSRVTTIEGLADGERLHPLQQAWIDLDVSQCGFCQPGQIMAAAALLKRSARPTDAEIDAIENVCRCGTYSRIREAIKSVSAEKPAAPS